MSVFWLACVLAMLPAKAAEVSAREPVRIGLTPVFLDDHAAFLSEWRSYLEKRLQQPVVFVQRGTYREVVDLLLRHRLDFAWICGYPYVRNQSQMKLLVVPAFDGRPWYRSYLIVPAGDMQTRSIQDLRGKLFAYSDPDSNSGFLYPQYTLAQSGENTGAFFRKGFFAWSHRNVVEAVGAGLAQGGAVDGYVWETLNVLHPEITAHTRVAAKSPEFGFPPVVAHVSIHQDRYISMQRALLDMSKDAEGLALLKKLNLSGFVQADPKIYDGIADMVKVLEAH